VGKLAETGPAFRYLVEGLEILQNRGYDSAGITTIRDGKLWTTKCASSGSTSDAIGRLSHTSDVHDGACVGIAHTRWATHGGKTDVNAHPHHDGGDVVSIVHNGVIDNADEIREALQKEGVVFRSQTDSEVIAQLLGKAIRDGETLAQAVGRLQSQMQGTWGIVAVSVTEPNSIVATTHGSPLLIGVGKGCMFIASEASAFSKYTNEFIVLKDDEVALITPQGHSLQNTTIEYSSFEPIATSPTPFPHWTLKEIFEQPEAVARSIAFGGRFTGNDSVKLGGLDSSRASLKTIRHLLIVGCGTSYYAGLAGAKIMRSLSALETVRVIDASEVSKNDFPKEGGGVLALSQSGETKDVHRAVMLANEENIFCFSIVNTVRSLIARATNCGLYMHAGRENGVASTKSFTCQVVCLALVAIWFSQNNPNPGTQQKRREVVQDLQRLPTLCGMVLNQIRPKCQKIAHHLLNSHHAFILGRGAGEPIAYEGSLKLKEIAYLHCEGYAGGALKHGPFALIENGTVIFLIVLEDEHYKYMKTVAHEVRARGAHVIAITNSPSLTADHSLANDAILLPHDGYFTSLLAVLPLQLIAYELAILKGNNPDRPRNLAKCVTVD